MLKIKKLPECSFDNCQRTQTGAKNTQGNELCVGTHAEWEAIMNCSPKDRKNAVLYCTMKPCIICTKLIINSGISEVYYDYDYQDENADKLIKMSGIKFERVEKPAINKAQIVELLGRLSYCDLLDIEKSLKEKKLIYELQSKKV